MSEFKGTLGPWHVWARNTVQFEVHSGSERVCEFVGLDDARLIAAAPELLEAQTMGVQLNTPDFLDWIAERLVNVYGESPHVDFVLSLKDRAATGRASIAKALGETK